MQFFCWNVESLHEVCAQNFFSTIFYDITYSRKRCCIFTHISFELHVSVGLIWKNNRDMQEQTNFIGNIPIMNSLGTS